MKHCLTVWLLPCFITSVRGVVLPREVVTAVTAGVTSHWNGDYLYESENRSAGGGRGLKVVTTVHGQAWRRSCHSRHHHFRRGRFSSPSYSWVIPYESTEKNMTIFCLDFWPKKSKVFDILVIKTFFKTKFWLYLTTFRFDQNIF